MTKLALAPLALLLILACDTEAEPLVPGATALPTGESEVSGMDLVADGDGFAVAWSELGPEDEEESLVFMRIDRAGAVVAPPRRVLPVGSRFFTSVKLLVTPGGYLIWYWDHGRRMAAAALDPSGELLVDADTGERHAGSNGCLGSAVIGDAVGAVHRSDEDRTIRFRTYSDQAEPRTDPVVLGRGHSCALTATADRFEVVWADADTIRRATFGTDGTMLRMPETLAADTGDGVRGAMAVAVDDGFLAGWIRVPAFGEGASFQLLRDDGSGWPEPRVLFPDNRLESLDVTVAAHADSALVVWQSDTDRAVPQVLTGSLPLTGDARALLEVGPLTPAGIEGHGPRAAGGATGVGVLVKLPVDEARRVFFRHYP